MTSSISPPIDHQAVLEKLFTKISEVSSLPGVACEIVELVEEESASALDLLEVVEKDPALAVRILREVNSSHYGLRNKIADLQSAISLLGFREIRNLALTVYVSRMFHHSGVFRQYSRDKLWNHLLGTAGVARLISEICGKASPDESYLAGLLHDIGYILLDEHLRKHFCKVIEKIGPKTSTTKIEQEIFTFDHTELGAFVASKWEFPDQISDAIRYHHIPEEYDGKHQEIVCVVAMANYFASRSGYPSLGVHNVSAVPDAIYARLGLREHKLEEIWGKLPDVLESASTIATA